MSNQNEKGSAPTAKERRVIVVSDGDYSIVGLTKESQPMDTLILPVRAGLSLGFKLWKTTERAFYYKEIPGKKPKQASNNKESV